MSTPYIPRHPDILRAEIHELEKQKMILLDALHKIDANAGESVEWIRRVARKAIAETSFKYTKE